MREIRLARLLRMATLDVTDAESDKADREGTPAALDNDVTRKGRRHDPPSLAAILLCREATPSIMEHEKAIVVMKEHDYAKIPEFTQLAPLLRRLTSRAAESSEPLSPQKGSLLSVQETISQHRKETLLNSDNGISPYLRTMVSLQATLIHDLQEQSYIKEIETNAIRREKEQLEARLERMERRLNILQKHSKEEQGSADDEAPPTAPNTPTRTQCAKPNSVIRLSRVDGKGSGPGRKSRSRSSSVETLISKRQPKNLTLNNSLEVSHKATLKRDLEECDHTPNHTPVPKRPRSTSGGRKQEASYLRTNTPYSGLNLQLPLLSSNNEQEESQPDIKVPSWHINIVSTSLPRNALITEDTSNEAFSKRHSKLETDEKRRKRWDAQRIRQKFHHEQLLKRYMMKEGLPTQEKKKEEILTTFQPKLEEVEGIEITDTLIVSAFGQPLPNLPPCSFHLPNFNPHVASSGKGRGKSRLRLSTNSGNSIDETSHVTSHVT